MAQASLSNPRTFRFPRFAILTMVLGYAGTVLAIETGRVIATGHSPDTTPIYRVFAALLAVFGVPCLAAAAGSFISFARQRRSK